MYLRVLKHDTCIIAGQKYTYRVQYCIHAICKWHYIVKSKQRKQASLPIKRNGFVSNILGQIKIHEHCWLDGVLTDL